MTRGRGSVPAAVGAVWLLAACSGVDGPVVPGPPTTSARPPTAAHGPPAPTAGATLRTSCTKGVKHDAPQTGGIEVGDAVVLQGSGPSAPLGSSMQPGLPVFVKVPVFVRGDAEVVVSLARDEPDGVAIAWASSPRPPGVEVTFEPCGTGHEWTTYPGGFVLDAPRCVTVVVEVDGRSTRQQVPLGASCPG